MTDNEQLNRQIKVRFDDYDPAAVEYATGVQVNFTGTEFLVSLIRALPQMFDSPENLPEEIKGVILFRAAIAPQKWVDAVESFTRQITEIRKQGALPSPSLEESL